jgi:hypothetical protein
MILITIGEFFVHMSIFEFVICSLGFAFSGMLFWSLVDDFIEERKVRRGNN